MTFIGIDSDRENFRITASQRHFMSTKFWVPLNRDGKSWTQLNVKLSLCTWRYWAHNRTTHHTHCLWSGIKFAAFLEKDTWREFLASIKITRNRRNFSEKKSIVDNYPKKNQKSLARRIQKFSSSTKTIFKFKSRILGNIASGMAILTFFLLFYSILNFGCTLLTP